MKFKPFLLAAALLLTVSPLTAHADTAVSETADEETLKTPDGMFSYTILEDGTVKLYKFLPTDHPGELVIPSEIDGAAVTAIDNACFLNTYSLTSVTIPATVKEMGDSVFFGCSSLESIVLEEGNTSFSTDENGVLFGDSMQFLICYPPGKSDESYTIPETVDEIAPSSFAYADNLKSVIIPDSVAYLDGWAFSYSGIERITLPDSVVQMDDYCFAYCTNLTEIDLGEGIESIYNAAFAACENLTEIEFPESLTYIGQCAFAGTGLRSVTIPANVSQIDYCAFGYNADLVSIGGFVIKGYAGSAAQSYCYAVDEENDYQNNFTFIDLSNPDNAVSRAEDSAADSAADVTEAQQDITEAPAVKKSNHLLTILAVCGGVIVVLAAVLVVLLVKKPKSADSDADEDEE